MTRMFMYINTALSIHKRNSFAYQQKYACILRSNAKYIPMDFENNLWKNQKFFLRNQYTTIGILTIRRIIEGVRVRKKLRQYYCP